MCCVLMGDQKRLLAISQKMLPREPVIEVKTSQDRHHDSIAWF